MKKPSIDPLPGHSVNRRNFRRRLAKLYPGLVAVLAMFGFNPALAGDWLNWRGPRFDGHADPHQSPPLQWNEEEGVRWKQAIPGRGHGSPIVVDDVIYLPVGDRSREVQSVLCVDRATGTPRWETIIHHGNLTEKNEKGSPASSTICCDGKYLFVNFLNNNAVFTTALTLDGKQVWQKKITDYVIHQGYGSSPMPYKDLLLVSADNKGGGAIVALRRTTGEEVWRHARPATPNYPSPIVLKASGRDQLIMIGCDLVTSLDPASGSLLWETAGATTECVISTVTDGELIFTSGGYPRNHLAAVRADGSGETVWETGDRVYVPSPLIKDGYLYAVLDAGVAACWEAATGKQQWKARIGGNYTASPVLVGERIYVTNENGETVIFKASPVEFEKLGENKLGDDCFATPTIVDGQVFLRVGSREGDNRQEYLYCIESSPSDASTPPDQR